MIFRFFCHHGYSVDNPPSPRPMFRYPTALLKWIFQKENVTLINVVVSHKLLVQSIHSSVEKFAKLMHSHDVLYDSFFFSVIVGVLSCCRRSISTFSAVLLCLFSAWNIRNVITICLALGPLSAVLPQITFSHWPMTLTNVIASVINQTNHKFIF